MQPETTTMLSLTRLAKLPFTLLVFFAVELPKAFALALLNTFYVWAQSLITLFFKPVSRSLPFRLTVSFLRSILYIGNARNMFHFVLSLSP